MIVASRPPKAQTARMASGAPQSPWVVIGAGYTGERVAAGLAARGAPVTITRRSATDARVVGDRLNVDARAFTLGDPADWLADATVICLAPPGSEPDREVTRLAPARRLVYVSSTAVYAPASGDWVDEQWPIAPTTRAGHARVAAERAAAEHRCAVWLRVAGIHGPDRGLIERIRSGSYRVIGDGTSCISRIHVDDLVTAIIAAGERGEVLGPVNIADDDPAPSGEVADTIAAAIGAARPPRVAASELSNEVAGMLTANRRIANARMKRELGVVLRYPSWRSLIATRSPSSPG